MKVVFVVAPENFRDEELFETRRVLEEGGVKCHVASTVRGTLHGSRGGTVAADMLVGEISARYYDAIVFVGGSGVEDDGFDENPKLHAIAREFKEHGKVVAAICAAPIILARAGVLQGKSATCYPSASSMAVLRQGGAHYAARPVIQDGLVVTANGAQSSVPFAHAILELLDSRP